MYLPPTLESNSLSQNRTGYSPVASNLLELDTAISVLIEFRGSQFTHDARTLITYGDPPRTDTYTCTLVPARSSATRLACLTAGGSQGTALPFHVSVAGQQSVPLSSEFLVSFPTTPTVTSVTGCPLTSPDLLTTLVCTTLHAPRYTLHATTTSAVQCSAVTNSLTRIVRENRIVQRKAVLSY